MDELLVAKMSEETDDGEDMRAVMRADIGAQKTGMVWEAVLIAPGLSQSSPKFLWTERVLQNAVQKFDNVDIAVYDAPDGAKTHLPENAVSAKKYLTRQSVGRTKNPRWGPGRGIVADIVFFPHGKWVADALTAAMSQGVRGLGLSIDAPTRGRFVFDQANGRYVDPAEIVGVSSVDVVTHPAAGGEFLRAVAARAENRGEDMKLLDMLKKLRPDLAATLGDDPDEAAVMRAVQDALTQKAEPKTPDEPAPAVDLEAVEARMAKALDERLAAAEKKAEMRAQMARVLEARLGASRLPDPAKERVRQAATNAQDEAAIDALIKSEADYLAQMDGEYLGPDIGDQTRTEQGPDTLAKIQGACHKLFGLDKAYVEASARMSTLDHRPFFDRDLRAAMDVAAAMDGIPAVHGVRDLYTLLSGDSEMRDVFMRRNLPADLRACMDITSATFSHVLGNTLGRRLAKDYREVNYREDILISFRKSVKDFRQQEAVLVGGFPDISTIDPETSDYDEIAAVTDEESTYSVTTRGNLLTFTRKVFVNDDIGVIERSIRKLARAIARTHGKFVWNFVKSNANCSDGTAIFTSGHGNLGSSALTIATGIAALKALATMTEKDSGEYLGLMDGDVVRPNLVVPWGLLESADSVAKDDHYFTSDDLTTKTNNPLKDRVNVVVASILSDANDWYMFLPPEEIDLVEMGYLGGREEPEFFVADEPKAGAMFTSDKIKYKFRHEYSGAWIDCRGGYKAVVAA
jgi:hypothetical protein